MEAHVEPPDNGELSEVSTQGTVVPMPGAEDPIVRHAEPADYGAVLSVIDDWWGGRKMGHLLPKLFFVHFRPTSFVVELNGRIVGFLVGFVSQTFPDEAYIHFAGVHPEHRGRGLGRALYERFFGVTRTMGCRLVRCITAPVNRDSVAFHLRLGFAIEAGETEVDGLPVTRNYDRRGGDRVLLVKTLDEK